MSLDTINTDLVETFEQSRPCAVDVQPALDVIPGMTPRTILHAGPPISWEQMCGPMRGAVAGALVYEGLVRTLDEADALAGSGAIRFESAHDHDAVGPMAGIISPRMPVWIFEDEASGLRGFANLNEGSQNALRYGANGPAVIERLNWMETVLAPVLRAVLVRSGPLDVLALVANALLMGDECHSRNAALNRLLLQWLTPAVLDLPINGSTARSVYAFISERDYFSLNLTMGACKTAWMGVERTGRGSVVTAISRNGVDVGIRVSGAPGQWWTAPAPAVTVHTLPGFTAEDANRDIGDSAITETSGLGGMAGAAAPAVCGFVGGTPALFRDIQLSMYAITVGESRRFRVPSLDFRGTPTGIDVHRVVAHNHTPVLTTGVAHKLAGVGMVGAGYVQMPLAMFAEAAL
ncbi:MAG TPA: DUF1116 domain-containing protein, partial [Chloroflexota bacterium]